MRLANPEHNLLVSLESARDSFQFESKIIFLSQDVVDKHRTSCLAC